MLETHTVVNLCNIPVCLLDNYQEVWTFMAHKEQDTVDITSGKCAFPTLVQRKQPWSNFFPSITTVALHYSSITWTSTAAFWSWYNYHPERHNLKGSSARKKPLLQNRHKRARLRFATAHGDKYRTFWRNVLWSDETKIELFGHNDQCYVRRKKGEACKPEDHHPNREACCVGALLQEGLVHFTK